MSSCDEEVDRRESHCSLDSASYKTPTPGLFSGSINVSEAKVRHSVGILGGLGPLAGAHFYRRLVEKTPARGDSDHLPVVLVSDPTIPSRVDNLFGDGPTPVPALVRLARLLEMMGASVIAVPSSTTHAYYSEIQEAVGAQVINLLSEVAVSVVRSGYRRPAILGTTPTVALDLYRPYFMDEAEPIYPDPVSQEEVHDLVFTLKKGGDPSQLSERLREIALRPWSKGADSMVLACTELCLFDLNDIGVPVFSATDILADTAIQLYQKLS